MAEAPQAGEVATRGAYQVAGTVIDCEVTQRAGLTLTGANLACYLSLQMSPTEAEGKRCQAHVCTVASWGWSRGGAAVSFVTHNCSSCFALWLFLPLKVQRPCLTTDTSSHLFVGLPSFIPFPTYFGNWLNWVYFSTVTMATTSSHGSRFVIRSM